MDSDSPALADLKKLHETQAMSSFSKQQQQKNSIEMHPNLRKGVFISPSKTRRRSTSNLTEDQDSLLATNNLTDIERILRAEERDEDSARKLYEHIKHFAFFEAINTKFPGTHFDDNGFTQLCAKLKYEKVSANKTLFQEGDSTNGRVYFIYSGQVNLYKKNSEGGPVQTEQAHSQVLSLRTIDSGSIRKVTLDLGQQSSRPFIKGKHQTVVIRSEKSLFDDKLEELEKYGQADAELRTGQFFGEQALIDWEPRQFTAVTNETCELLVLTRRDFKFLRENYDEKRKKLGGFLEEYVPQMSNVNTWQLLDELLCVIQEKTFERGTFIINEGEISDTFFAVFDGTCELIKNVRIDESTNLKDTLVSIKQLLRVAPAYSEQLSICTVQKGTFLGDEVVFGPDRTYNFSVRVTSGFATVFMIEKTKFVQKFPLLVREEIAKLFHTKKKHYARAVRTSLSKKYANMEAASLRPSTSTKTADERLLSSPIVLIPRKGGDMHFKARSGIFRGDKSETDINGRISPEPTKRVAGSYIEDGVGEISPRKTLKSVNNSEIGGMSPRRLPIMGQFVNKTNSDYANKEEENVESPRKNLLNGIINLKEKVCHTQVQTDHPKDNSYVSTSPLLKSKTLTSKSIAVRKILLAAGSSSNTRASERKSSDRFLESGEITTREEPETTEFSDYGKVGTSKDSTYVDRIGTMEPVSRASSVGKFSRAAVPKVMNLDSFERTEKGKASEEMQNTLLEIRTMLMEKDSKSREFIMTRKRLESKYLNLKPPKVETERDGSLGKRLDILLKPMRERTAGGLGHVKTLSEINISSASPVKKTNIHVQLLSDNSPLTASGSATRRGNRGKFGTEIIANNGFNDYLDNSTDKSPFLLTGIKPHHFSVVTADSQRKARNERQMALLRAKFKMIKGSDSSYELPQKNLGIQLKIQPVTSRGEGNSMEKIQLSLSSRRPKV